MPWSLKDIPDQSGRLAIVTGANTGLGYETALALAGAGAEVIVAARTPAKGEDAVRRILAAHPNAKVRFERLDLASLAGVRAFAARIKAAHGKLNLLVNNAGVMTPPKRQTTEDGFELQFGVNYLAHFLLTAELLPLLKTGDRPRVVNLSSDAHHTGKIDFDDLQSERRYRPWAAYSQSKLAMLIFAFALQRRSDAGGWGLLADAAHPGYARTELIANGPGSDSLMARVGGTVLAPFLSQSAAAGALPTLYAATAPEATPGGYYGPDGPFELIGAPKSARVARQAMDEAVAGRLWQASESLTGARFG